MTLVAIAESSRWGEVRFLGEIPSTPEALHRLVERLKSRHRQLSFCYEAGPCGYGVHRLLCGLGQDCSVVAPRVVQAAQIADTAVPPEPRRTPSAISNSIRDGTTLRKRKYRRDAGHRRMSAEPLGGRASAR
jgi:transposase